MFRAHTGLRPACSHHAMTPSDTVIGAGLLSKAAGIPCHYVPLPPLLKLSPTKYITLGCMITLSSYLYAHSSLVYWKQQVHTPMLEVVKSPPGK